jgi:hypothetical protein
MKAISDTEIESEIQEKKLVNAPRITPEILDDMIARSEFHVFDGRHTICCMYLKNGFTVFGEAACRYRANYDKSLGEKISYTDARNKLWAFAGYEMAVLASQK